MALTSSERASIEKLQRQREQEMERLKVEIKQHSIAKEAAFNEYQKSRASVKRLKREYNLLTKEIEDDQNATDDNKKEYRKPSKGEINIVVHLINQRLITRNEGAESLGIPYSSMCRYVLNNGAKPRPKNYKPPNLKVLDEHIVELMKYIEKVPDATQPMMCKHLKNKFGINISQSSISRILKSMKT